MRTWFLVFGCALVLAASGCGQTDGGARPFDGASGAGGTSSSGGSSSSGGTTSGAGTAGAGAAGAGSGGSGGSSSSAVTSRPISGTEKLSAWVLGERFDSDGNVISAVYARFVDGPVEWAGCTRHDVGPCYWIECASVHVEPAGMEVSAGELTFTIGSLAHTLAFDGEGFSNFNAGALWSRETDVVRVDAGGGADFPTFTAAVTPPSEVTLVSPAIMPGTENLALGTSSDLALAWSGGAAGAAVFTIRSDSSLTPALACDFDAAAGAGVVPAVALQALDAVQTYQLYFYSRNRVETSAGDWSVLVTALEYPSVSYWMVRNLMLE